MKVLGLAKNAGRWFSPRLGPSPAQSSPAPHSVNRCLDLLDDVFEDIAYRRMCGRGLGLIRPITPEPTAEDDMDEDDDEDDWMFVEDPIRAIFAPPRPLALVDHHHPRRGPRRRLALVDTDPSDVHKDKKSKKNKKKKGKKEPARCRPAAAAAAKKKTPWGKRPAWQPAGGI